MSDVQTVEPGFRIQCPYCLNNVRPKQNTRYTQRITRRELNREFARHLKKCKSYAEFLRSRNDSQPTKADS